MHPSTVTTIAAVLVAVGVLFRFWPEARLIGAQRNSEVVEDFALLAKQLRVELDIAHNEVRELTKDMARLTARLSQLGRELGAEQERAAKLERQVRRLRRGPHPA